MKNKDISTKTGHPEISDYQDSAYSFLGGWMFALLSTNMTDESGQWVSFPKGSWSSKNLLSVSIGGRAYQVEKKAPRRGWGGGNLEPS